MIFGHVKQYCEQFDQLEVEDGGLDFKREVSRLSLACRRWSQALRPFLFRQLVLHTRSDVPFLLSIARSPLSSWLADYITTIQLVIAHNVPDHIQLSSWACRAICESAPALKSISIDGEDESSGVGETKKKNALIPCQQRVFLRTLVTVRFLILSDIRVPSFSSLLRLLNYASVEKLSLSDVSWGCSESAGLLHPHAYSTTTSKLKIIASTRCTDNHSPVWLFALASTRWNLPRRRPDQTYSSPLTTRIVMEILNIFLPNDPDGLIVVMKHCDSDGKLHFAITS